MVWQLLKINAVPKIATSSYMRSDLSWFYYFMRIYKFHYL